MLAAACEIADFHARPGPGIEPGRPDPGTGQKAKTRHQRPARRGIHQRTGAVRRTQDRCAAAGQLPSRDARMRAAFSQYHVRRSTVTITSCESASCFGLPHSRLTTSTISSARSTSASRRR